MYRSLKNLLVLGLTGFLAACAGGESRHAALNPLTPMPAAINEPSDAQLDVAVKSFLKESHAPAASIYSFRRTDLNSDGRRDALIIFKNPYGYWCGIYGCTMLVMEANEDSFKLVNAVQTVREPIYVSDTKTNGWNEIIMHISGRWTETKDVALQYDGEKYPANPSELPPYLMMASAGKRLFYE